MAREDLNNFGLADFGRWLARRFDAEEEYREGVEKLAPEASRDEVNNALEKGIDDGLRWTERRRAHRARAEGDLDRMEPLISQKLIENAEGDITGHRVLVSDPEAEILVAAEGGDFIIRTDHADRRIESPFDRPVIESSTRDNILEFIIRDESTIAANDIDDDPEVEVDGAAAAREIVEADPGRGMLVLEESGNRNANVLAGTLLEQYPEIDAAKAPELIESAATAIGLDALEDAYDAQFEPVADTKPLTEESWSDPDEETPEAPEEVLEGIEDIAEGRTASKEDLEAAIEESDHDPEADEE